MRMTPLLACAAAFAAAAPALAAGFASPEEIDSAVAEFTGAAIGTEGGARLPIDRRLRLAVAGFLGVISLLYAGGEIAALL